MGKIKYFVLIAIFFVVLHITAYGASISSNDLIDNASKYDGKEIVYTGEVIGDIMRRGDFAWINVYDGSNAIGIWIPYADSLKIKTTGSYENIGDTVQVEGIFHRACSQHGGEFDIHSSKIDLIEKGHKKITFIDPVKKYIAIVLLAVSMGVTWFVYRKQL